jgi:UDP-N-acetylmuramoyl-L-alanyl-D-glutamate--2,6-diaminopimelate ligase
MTLAQVLAGVRLKRPLPARLAALSVEDLEYDSRRVKKDTLFFAFAGARADGRQFARAAIEAGAVAVASDLSPPDHFSGNWIEVEHGRQALAVAARNFFSRPDERVALTGITGTNGKTTTSYLVDSILRAAGKITALVGTIEYHLGDRVLKAANTTPESLDLYRLFAELEQMGGTFATLEVSSHALALGRVYGMHFHTAVFTNLTRDHLDFHGSMENYFAAKQMLFTGAGSAAPRFAVINRDDKSGARIETGKETSVLWYGLGKDATVRARRITSSFEGLRFEVQTVKEHFEISSKLIGRINVYNILAACSVGLSYGLAPDTIARGISQCKAVPGRFERVDEGQPFVVVVDYAHTDDALRNVISMAHSLEPKRVITVFGCGGDRDRTKRPIMGEVAAELSDLVVLTSDNPRSEDPLDIMNDVLVGLRRKDTPCLAEPDRALAIKRAIEEARPGDTIILAGKGHETYQVLKDRTIPFDDREVAREVLRGFGYRRRADSEP